MATWQEIFQPKAMLVPGRRRRDTKNAAELCEARRLQRERNDIKCPPARYCAGLSTSAMELGFAERIKVMIFHMSSEVLMIVPNGGIGPVTTSFLTRV
jgi:hypothetical protein